MFGRGSVKLRQESVGSKRIVILSKRRQAKHSRRAVEGPLQIIVTPTYQGVSTSAQKFCKVIYL
jgi:hypothetical protein